MWFLYQILVASALLLAGPFLLLTRGAHYLASIPYRLTMRFTPRNEGRSRESQARDPIWFHAVSVGEVGVAATILQAFPSAGDALVTTVTPTGQDQAVARCSERARVAYLPFDLGFAVRRFLDHFEPRALVLVEGDLWPLLLRRVKQRNLPVVVVNGRVSDRSYRRMRRLRPLLGPLLQRVDCFGVQTDEDRKRLVSLGVPATLVVRTGNLKFDSDSPDPDPELADVIQSLAGGRPILMAASTMRGEEELVLEAFESAGGPERALLILAPRHPERWDDVASTIRTRELTLARRSNLDDYPDQPSVLLLDSLGELAGLFELALGAFVGGTLVPTGGHNPLEPAQKGIAVAAGPSMENFREIEQIFDSACAWRRVATAAELATVWRRWIEDPDVATELGGRAQALIDQNRGALARTLTLLEQVSGRRDREDQSARREPNP